MSTIQTHHLYQHQRVQPRQKDTINPHKLDSSNFKGLLSKEIQETSTLKVSKHANQRLSDRNVDISSKEWQLISQKLHDAQNKGINDSVVITKNAALLVNVKSQTVITAMDRKEATSHLFSKIDGAIIID